MGHTLQSLYLGKCIVPVWVVDMRMCDYTSKAKTPALEHGCLRWNRTWASWTVQWFFRGVARLHDRVRPREPKYQSFFNSFQQPRGRRSCSRINSSRVIFILPQCPVCLIRQQFQANIWTHRILLRTQKKKKKKTFTSRRHTDRLIGRHTHACRCVSTVEWVWAAGFKAVPVKEGKTALRCRLIDPSLCKLICGAFPALYLDQCFVIT